MQIKIGTKIIMEISAGNLRCLDNDLLSSKDWLVEGLKGKINHCKKRMFRQWIPILRDRSLDIPATDSALIALILSQSDYKDRRNREEVNSDTEDICLLSTGGNKKAKATCPWEATRIQIFETGQAPTDECDVH